MRHLRPAVGGTAFGMHGLPGTAPCQGEAVMRMVRDVVVTMLTAAMMILVVVVLMAVSIGLLKVVVDVSQGLGVCR